MRHVPALAVGNHQQAGVAAAPTTRSSAVQPFEPRRSKQASCGLTATQAGPAASISSRQRSPIASAAAPAGGLPRREPLRRPGWIRVEAEAYLAAALGDERREPVGKRCAQLG